MLFSLMMLVGLFAIMYTITHFAMLPSMASNLCLYMSLCFQRWMRKFRCSLLNLFWRYWHLFDTFLMYLIPVENNEACVQILLFHNHPFCNSFKCHRYLSCDESITPKIQRYMENSVYPYQRFVLNNMDLIISAS